MTVKINTIVRLLSCLYVFSDANSIMRKYRAHATANRYLYPHAINRIFPIANAVTSIYFHDADNKTSALFFSYDSENDNMHVHYAKHLKDVVIDYDVFKYMTVKDYHYDCNSNVVKNVQRILNSLSVDFQNVYSARNSKDFPAYVLKSMPKKVNLTKVRLTEDEKDNFFKRIEDYYPRFRSRSYCANHPARPFPRPAF